MENSRLSKIECLKTLYDTCVMQLNEDNRRLWTIFHVFTLLNGAMLALSASTSATSYEVKIITAIIAIFICVLWQRIQVRMGFWSSLWEEEAAQIEKIYIDEINTQLINKGFSTLPKTATVFLHRIEKIKRVGLKYSKIDRFFLCLTPKKRLKKRIPFPGMSTRKAGAYLPLIFLFAWLVFLGATILDPAKSKTSNTENAVSRSVAEYTRPQKKY